MSRSGYSDDCENLGLWRGTVASAIRGKRGQAFLTEMLQVLDAMPSKFLVAGDLQAVGGAVCAMGAVGLHRGVHMAGIDSHDRHEVAELFGISPALAAEIAYENDEGTWEIETPEQRWTRMRAWVVENLRAGQP